MPSSIQEQRAGGSPSKTSLEHIQHHENDDNHDHNDRISDVSDTERGPVGPVGWWEVYYGFPSPRHSGRCLVHNPKDWTKDITEGLRKGSKNPKTSLQVGRFRKPLQGSCIIVREPQPDGF